MRSPPRRHRHVGPGNSWLWGCPAHALRGAQHPASIGSMLVASPHVTRQCLKTWPNAAWRTHPLGGPSLAECAGGISCVPVLCPLPPPLFKTTANISHPSGSRALGWDRWNERGEDGPPSVRSRLSCITGSGTAVTVPRQAGVGGGRWLCPGGGDVG